MGAAQWVLIALFSLGLIGAWLNDGKVTQTKFANTVTSVVFLSVVLAWGGFWSPKCGATEIPQAAFKYRSDLIRNARLSWGLDAPVATLAAQIHQESGWNPAAVSRVGAKGLAQFMPSTADWIGGIVPDLAARTPENPAWALRAIAAYDRWLWERVSADASCDRMAMVLSSYNGGLGWLLKDKKAAAAAGADRGLWWGEVERFNAGRRNAEFAENRGYPRRILQVLEPRYGSWGARSCV